MNKMVKIGTLCLIVALFVAGVSGCKNDEGDGLVSTIGAPKIGDIKDLTSFGETGVTAVTATTPYSDVLALVSGFIGTVDNDNYYDSGEAENLGDALAYVQWEAFKKPFEDKYGDVDKWVDSRDDLTSFSASVDCNDSDTLKKLTGGTAEGTIKASAKQSWSHNRLTYGEYHSTHTNKIDDKVSSSYSGKGTYSITKGYVQFVDYDDDPTYKVAGIIKAEYSGKEGWTTKDIKDTKEEISTGSNSGKSKLALTVLISDGDKIAKIRFSTANDGAWRERSAGWGGSNNTSDIEVYSPTATGGSPLFTIPPSYINGRDKFRDIVVGDIRPNF